MIGRLAPSPTGALHLGNVRTFLIAWLQARQSGGQVILRIEDLDHPRDKPDATERILSDLRWLGFDWDETFIQSVRKPFYREALERLRAKRLVYPCICSRQDVVHAQSAPHAGEQLFYPGICRDRFSSWEEASCACAPRVPCWRFRVPEKTRVSFHDLFAGDYTQDVSSVLGDFPLAREAGGAGYTLAVVVDDALMGVTDVVRADDLLPATPAQILLYQALGFCVPQFCHVPLMIGRDGKRLAKRHGDTRVAAFRAQGIRPERILGYLAQSCGWITEKTCSLGELVEVFSLATIPPAPFVYEPGALGLN